MGLSDLQVKKTRGSEMSFATMSLAVADIGSGGIRRIISHPGAALDTGINL